MTSSPTALIQARMGSHRLPGKSLLDIHGQTMLGHVIERSRRASVIGAVAVATSTGAEDDPIAALCDGLAVSCFRGSPSHVLERMTRAATALGAATVVRVTADNPLVGPDVIDHVVDHHRACGADITTTYHSKSFPNGTVVSVLEVDAMERLCALDVPKGTREHIVSDLEFLKRHCAVEVVEAPTAWRRYDLRYCVDEAEDFEVVQRIVEHFAAQGHDPSTDDILRFLDTHPEVRRRNAELAARGY